MTASWGSGEVGAADEHIPSTAIDLGNGHSMVLNPEAVKALLHSPEAVRGITARARAVADSANQLAKHVGRSDRPSPEYTVEVENNPEDTRARARVRPNNIQAVLDNQLHQTLLKATDAHPSDPKLHADEEL